ncbi:transcription termination factor MTERF2, chloroplastic [Lathyrus oleraceus]|uniref:Uncharacterized protein n=1 Tax=Pisum sativum TaxID=3888 RepID=A0A9D5BRW5_PEA|nr:transcription termination factor MTERF2, chloroplastic-like [Pisum sativum]KAI5448511.1 hypothetical protein KIW84_015791 [Pisum sativum]
MLLSCQNHTLYLPSSSIHSVKNSKPNIIINCQTPNEQNQPIPRRHNSKSTSFLIPYLSHKNSDNHHSSPTELQDPIPHEEKVKLLELSLVRKRTPQFPGSIYAQSPSDSDVGSSLPPLRTLFRSRDEEEEVLIMKALEICRKVTEEVFKEQMRKGKFGITYTDNLVSKLGGFVDYVMIEVANLKRLPQYSHSTFNLHAKTVIEDSQVVQLIRWLKHNSLSYPLLYILQD